MDIHHWDCGPEEDAQTPRASKYPAEFRAYAVELWRTSGKSQRAVAIVTGGSRGIGRQTARRLARDGFAVVVNYAGSKVEADAAVEELVGAGAQAFAVQADVAEETAVPSMFDRAESTFGGVDVVAHAAGIMPLSPLVDLDLDMLDRVLRTNVRGTFVVVQQAARRLRPGGAIVNFSSSITRFSRPVYSAYGASKGAVEAITLILAREMRGRDITVNAVAPGPTATALFLERQERRADQRDRGRVAARAAGPAYRHRRGGGVPGRSRLLDQRPGDLHQRRSRLTTSTTGA